MAGNLAAKAPEAGELGEPIPIDPFAYTFSSWEQWEEWEKKSIPPPDTRPLSTSLKNPPKVNLFCASFLRALTNLEPSIL